MIPAFEQPTLSLGPLTIHAFGVLVAIAVIVGHRVFSKQATARGLDVRIGERLFTWMLIGGFIGAHLVHCFVYFPKQTLADPMSILRIWDGLSSFGGFLGAIVGGRLFVKRVQLGDATWRYLDVVAYCFPFGWIFGRLGCFVAFDHPGAETDFFLGQADRNGIVRHNLGLEEALFTIVLAGFFYWLNRKPRFVGFYLGLLPLVYAPVRFVLDFGRTVDVRYGGLTPGQWGAMGLLVLGSYILIHFRKRMALAQALIEP
ncbi:MAG TPA: prolipoprotein diacylglyceryl transferase [Polyangia bacterium]